VRRAERERQGDQAIVPSSSTATQEHSSEVGGRRLLTVKGIGAPHGLSESYVRQMVVELGFPPVVAKLATINLWLEEDVVAYREKRPVRRRPNSFNHLILSSGLIADRLGVTRQTLNVGIRRRTPSFPQPDGRLARSPWWDAAKFQTGCESIPTAPRAATADRSHRGRTG
jgi:hypothetical protein